MTNALGGIFITVFFGTMALAPDRFARWSMRSQNRTWGFHFGEREIRRTALMARSIGVIGVIGGISLILSAR
jgi:hypothetical protein